MTFICIVAMIAGERGGRGGGKIIDGHHLLSHYLTFPHVVFLYECFLHLLNVLSDIVQLSLIELISSLDCLHTTVKND